MTERRRDPEVTLALLWGTGARPTRGPRQRTSVEEVVAAAIALADAEGLAAVSMRRVADAVGVSTMSLYTYVPGKGDLHELMVDAAVAGQPLPRAEQGWRPALEGYARDSWGRYRAHAWLLHAAVADVFGPGTTTLFDAALGCLGGLGLGGRERIAVVRALDAYVRGAAHGMDEIVTSPSRTGQDDREWWESREPFLMEVLVGERFPALGEVEADGGFDPPADASRYGELRMEEDFEFGLQRLLDGVDAEVRRRGRRGSRRAAGG